MCIRDSYYTTGINNVASVQPVNIYPVPASNELTIALGNTQNQTSAIAIHSMNGAVVKQWNTKDNTTTTDVSTLPNGTYALYVKNEDGVLRASKFTISR